jgi:hypothetical protein
MFAPGQNSNPLFAIVAFGASIFQDNSPLCDAECLERANHRIRGCLSAAGCGRPEGKTEYRLSGRQQRFGATYGPTAALPTPAVAGQCLRFHVGDMSLQLQLCNKH